MGLDQFNSNRKWLPKPSPASTFTLLAPQDACFSACGLSSTHNESQTPCRPSANLSCSRPPRAFLRANKGVARIFQSRGGPLRAPCVKQRALTSFLTWISWVVCLKKRLTLGGHGHPRTPLPPASFTLCKEMLASLLNPLNQNNNDSNNNS